MRKLAHELAIRSEPLIEAARVELQQALARLEARTKEMLQRPSVHC